MAGGEAREGPERIRSHSQAACCKVSRSASAFGLDDVDTELTRRRRHGESYRALAEYFNVRLLQRAISESNLEGAGALRTDLFDDDVAGQLYAILTDKNSSDAKRADVRDRLQNVGIDADRLSDAFVSHVTMGSHLVDCLHVEPASAGVRDFDDRVGVIQWALRRASKIIEASIHQLARDEEVYTGTLEFHLLVHVTCMDCGDTMHLQRFLDDRGCVCRGDGSRRPSSQSAIVSTNRPVESVRGQE